VMKDALPPALFGACFVPLPFCRALFDAESVSGSPGESAARGRLRLDSGAAAFPKLLSRENPAVRIVCNPLADLPSLRCCRWGVVGF
jgi:hypothetical protein